LGKSRQRPVRYESLAVIGINANDLNNFFTFSIGNMVVRLLKPMLAPVLRAQAKRLHRIALELPEPTGDRTGLITYTSPPSSSHYTLSNAPLSIIIVGDSCAAGVGARTQDEALASRIARALSESICASVAWHLIAKTGLTSGGVLDLLHTQIMPRADIGIVIVGVNDISNDVPLRMALRKRQKIVRLLTARCGIRRAVFPALPEVERFPLLPQPLAWYGGFTARQNNAMQARWAAHPRRKDSVTHLAMDGIMHPSLMAEDGFHPSPPLYEKTAQRIVAHIVGLLQKSEASKTLS
jgi:lysophospholipase L1-like esterase